MRVGLVARANTRGLGIQSWEFARHMDPAAVLIVDAGQGDVTHPHWYPEATRLPWAGGFHRRSLERWFERVDVVWSAETFYGRMFYDWAEAAGVPTVCHINPEFATRAQAARVFWSATSWRLEHLPAGTQVVPYPVAADRWPQPVEPHDGPCRWLHVAGKAALADRNGTMALLEAVRHLREPCELRIVVQDGRRLDSLPAPGHVKVDVVGPVDDYWTMYDGCDALVMPRRFGGLCLPVQEAMGAGLAVLMPDCSPNRETWPVATFRVRDWDTVEMPVGIVPIANISASALAAAMDSLADPNVRRNWQAQSATWAAEHSWDVWADRYRAMFAEVGAWV